MEGLSNSELKLVDKPEAKSSKDVVFKRPSSPPTYPGPSKKPKRKVLSEEKFAEALEKIIQRECFPDLEKLKAQNAYLDAVSNNDIQMMRELHSKYGSSCRGTPSFRDANETPDTFETPSSIDLSSMRNKNAAGASTPSLPGNLTEQRTADDAKSVTSEVSSTSGKKKNPHDLSLNEFLSKYTSEDNQSFQEIIQESIRRHKLKYPWLFKEDDESLNDKVMQALPLPSASEQQSLEYQRPNKIEMWPYKDKNAVMYIPDGAPYTSKELIDLARKQNEVKFKNTRFPSAPFKTDSEKEKEPETPSTQSLNLIRGITEGKIGLDGKEVNVKTPSVNGFKYVRTPSPTPGGDETPFLTWGEIEGTPFRLDAGDTPVPSSIGTPYRMIQTSNRERIALELAEKASQRYRDKKQKTIEVAKSYLASPSPRPKTKVERMSSMSPAAQRFAKNLLKRSDAGTPRTPR